jgi:hypothetical protein
MQRLQFAPPIILDEMAVISLETPEKSPDLNVRFCLEAGEKGPGQNLRSTTHPISP